MAELLRSPEEAVVIDPGSFRWRIGLANMPKCKSSFITDVSMLDNTAVENEGAITRFDSTEVSLAYYERYIRHGLQMLRCDRKGVHICLAVPLGYGVAYRRDLAQVILESIGAKSVFFASQPLLAGFSSGHPSCIVIDSGYSYTSIFGLNDLYPEKATELILPIGGRDIDRYLTHLSPGLKSATPTNINYIKSHFCEVSSEKSSVGGAKKDCQLPDETVLKLGGELKMAPELLFNPPIGGLPKTSPIDKAIIEAADKLPRESAASVLRNVVVSGGNLKFIGLCERLEKEISGRKRNACVKVWKNPNGESGVWRGGAVFASMPTFVSMRITKDSWIEHGELIIRKRWL